MNFIIIAVLCMFTFFSVFQIFIPFFDCYIETPSINIPVIFKYAIIVAHY